MKIIVHSYVFSGPNRNVWFMIFPYFHQDDGPVESLSKASLKANLRRDSFLGSSSIAALYTLNIAYLVSAFLSQITRR